MTDNHNPLHFLKHLLLSVDTKSEDELRLQHFTVFVMLGLPIMVPFLFYHLVSANYVIAALILIPILTLGGGWLLLRRAQNGALVYRSNIILFALLVLYCFVRGGDGGSQSLWMYTFPLIAFFLFGKTEGLFWNFVVFLVAVLFVATPLGKQVGYDYPTAFAVRFLGSYLAVFGIGYWFEHFRASYQAGMESEQAELVRERQRLTELVTERERAERALLASEERFRTLSDAAFEGLVISEDGRVLDANRALLDILGYEIEELRGRELLDFVVPSDRELVVDKIRSQSPDLYEHRAIRKDGAVLDVEVRGQTMPYMGRPTRMTAIRDVTKRKRAEEERLQLERRVRHSQKLESLGVLAGGIAHDFNNLLMGVLGNAELAALELPPGSQAGKNIEHIEKAAHSAADLARQMLAYSGRGHFVIEPVDLKQAVLEMGHLAQASVSKGTALNFELNEDLPAILADTAQIGQVVMNLITNASEALGSEDGVVTVSTGKEECDRAYLDRVHADADCEEGTYVFVEVTDTGVGMDAMTIAKMFDPFFSTKFVGRGLGLAAVLGIVRGHKGVITVDSDVGKGTAVKTLFPATDAHVSSLGGAASGSLEPLTGKTILVVDDEETVLEVAHKLLATAGCQVKTAKDGREGLEVFEKHSDGIDCVLLDLTMPQMGGAEMFEELRRVTERVPVILASGYSKSEVELQFGDRGFAGFIQKPYTLRELTRKIGEAIA